MLSAEPHTAATELFVANALEIPEDQYAERPGRNLAAKKKSHGHIVKHVIENQEEYEKKVKEYEK